MSNVRALNNVHAKHSPFTIASAASAVKPRVILHDWISMNWIDRTYSGQSPLWKVFWFGYVAPLLPLTIAIGILKETAARIPSFASFAFFLVIFLYQAWLAVSMWRCAPNVRYRAFFWLGRIVATITGLGLFAAALNFVKGGP